MLTEAGCQARRRRLWEQLDENFKWALIADPRHINYFSGFQVQPLSFSGGERCLLLLERDGPATLIGDNFAIRSAATDPFVDREVVEDWYDHEHSVINRDHALVAGLRLVADQLAQRPGLVESEWLPVAAWEVIVGDSTLSGSEPGFPQKIDLGSIVRELRRNKEPDEIELLELCMRAGAAGQTRAREVVVPGISEFEVYREVQAAALQELGSPGLVYGDFRATNAQMPKAGGLPTDYKLQSGDMFILDYSVVLHGYRSDFTNTIAVGGPSDEQEMLYRLCEAAMQAGESRLKAGVAASEVYAAVSHPLEEAGYGRLSHHAGHGIGLAHPEPPILVPDSTDVLRAGDVVTLEPGLYIEGIGGIRIEHNYLILDSGFRRLSDHLISLM